MEFTLKGTSKNGKQAIYGYNRATVRFALTAFVDGVAPQTLEIAGPFVEPKVKAPKMTAEERKAFKAANPKPKPTAAEKVAAAKARYENLQAALEL